MDTIESGAFQRTPQIEAIILNKNRLTRIRTDMFQGLRELYSLDLQGNRLSVVEPYGFANLKSLRHLDIRYVNDVIVLAWSYELYYNSYNLLQTLPMNTFDGTFEPTNDDRRVLFCCGKLSSYICNKTNLIIITYIILVFCILCMVYICCARSWISSDSELMPFVPNRAPDFERNHRGCPILNLRFNLKFKFNFHSLLHTMHFWFQ